MKVQIWFGLWSYTKVKYWERLTYLFRGVNLLRVTICEGRSPIVEQIRCPKQSASISSCLENICDNFALSTTHHHRQAEQIGREFCEPHHAQIFLILLAPLSAPCSKITIDKHRLFSLFIGRFNSTKAAIETFQLLMICIIKFRYSYGPLICNMSQRNN